MISYLIEEFKLIIKKNFECDTNAMITDSNFYYNLFLFESLDLEWKIIYVGSSESKEYDQVLDSIMVGPVPPGVNQFIFHNS